MLPEKMHYFVHSAFFRDKTLTKEVINFKCTHGIDIILW